MDGFIIARSERVTTLTIDRPEKRNAITTAMWEGLPGVLAEIADDPRTDVLIVTGSGGHFSAGSDINDLPDELDDFWRINTAAEDAVARFPKPTIAAVRGACIGGGTEITAACDIRIADDTAVFGITASRLGVLYPKGPTDRLTALIGPGSAKYLLFTGAHVDARTAAGMGLLDEVVPDAAARAREIAAELVSRSQLSIRFVKHMLLGADPEATSDLRAAARAELDEGREAFAAKRRPEFPSAPRE